ncbi:MAG: DUF3124 domain-containing protein [Thermodesulfobacteriota bacterium]
MKIRNGLLVWIVAFLCSSAGPVWAQTPPVRGQTVYAAVYSHIYSGDRERPIYLAATLSIRNTDLHQPIRIIGVDYHDSEGRLLTKYLAAPIALPPLSSTRYVIKESDKSGGSGACFIVRWNADRKVVPPLVESVMIGTRGQQGISFTSRGQVIAEETE